MEDLGVAGTIATEQVAIKALNMWLEANADVEVIDIKIIDYDTALLIYRKEVN